MRKTLLAGAVTAALGFASTAMAAPEMVVIASSGGAPHQLGDMVDGGDTLTLASGQRLVLIAPDGQQVSLDGPYSGVPAPDAGVGPENRLFAAFSQMVQERKDVTALGAVRFGDDDTGAVPHPWAVNVGAAGDHCVRRAGQTYFWRLDSQVRSDFSIRRRGESEVVATVAWPKGSDILTLPPNFPPESGSVYEVSLDNAPAVTLTLWVMPEDLKERPFQAVWMRDQGCTAQLNSMIEAMARDQ